MKKTNFRVFFFTKVYINLQNLQNLNITFFFSHRFWTWKTWRSVLDLISCQTRDVNCLTDRSENREKVSLREIMRAFRRAIHLVSALLRTQALYAVMKTWIFMEYPGIFMEFDSPIPFCRY